MPGARRARRRRLRLLLSVSATDLSGPRVTYTIRPSVATSMNFSEYPSSRSRHLNSLPSLAFPNVPSRYSRWNSTARASVSSRTLVSRLAEIFFSGVTSSTGG